jgi:hypothetical protein
MTGLVPHLPTLLPFLISALSDPKVRSRLRILVINRTADLFSAPS